MNTDPWQYTPENDFLETATHNFPRRNKIDVQFGNYHLLYCIYNNQNFKITSMQKEVLLEMVKQNEFTSHFSLDRVTSENAHMRLNHHTASVGFIFRHIGETINLFCQFFGIPTDVKNTTIGKTDAGEDYDINYSRQLIENGYQHLKYLVNSSTDDDWLKPVETPFFGTISRARLFAHMLFHNSHHAGQISMTLAKGTKILARELSF